MGLNVFMNWTRDWTVVIVMKPKHKVTLRGRNL